MKLNSNNFPQNPINFAATLSPIKYIASRAEYMSGRGKYMASPTEYMSGRGQYMPIDVKFIESVGCYI